MQRDMTSPIDGSLSTRYQGQLVSEAVMVTKPRRIGGITEMRPAMPVRPVDHLRARPVGLADIEISGLGKTTWGWIGVAAALGAVTTFLLLRRNGDSKKQAAAALLT